MNTNTDPGTKLKVGLIGNGFMGSIQAVLLNFHPRVELAAVCEPDSGGFSILQETGMTEGVYSDVRDMLSSQELDAVWICSPPSLHLPAVREAARQGTHIFSVPPLAESFSAAREMLRVSENEDGLGGIGYHFPHQRMFREARAHLADGLIGEVKRVRGSIYWSRRVSDTERDPPAFDRKGSGMIEQSGAALFILLNWMLGPAKSLFAQLSPPGASHPEGSTILLDYSSGVLGLIDISWSRPGYPLQSVFLTVEGMNGIMEVCSDHLKVHMYKKTSGFDSGWTCIYPSDLPSVSPFFYQEEGYYECTADFVDRCLTGEPPDIGWTEAAEVMKMVEAVHLSVRDRKAITLDEVT